MRFACLLLMLLCLSSPALAREWYRPPWGGREIVNPDLTPARALRHGAKAGWNGQLVLWEGRVASHALQGGLDRLVLRTAAGEVPVRFTRRALNLEYDRTGYRVAVKGRLQVSRGRVTGLEGLSIILLDTPAVWSYREFLGARPPDVESFLAWWIGFHNPEQPTEDVARVASHLVKAARENGLDPLLFASLVQIESAFDQDAVSSSGALGLGQLMPFTARELGVDPRDPAQNLAGSARMVSGLVRDWQGSYAPALAGYNCGPNLVRRLGGQVPNIPQTANYVYFIGYVHQEMSRAAERWGVTPVAPVAAP